MALFVILFILLVSFTIHIFSLITYLLTRNNKYFNRFFATAMINILVGIGLSVYSLKNPAAIRGIDFKFFLWVMSGIAMAFVLYIKVGLIVKIYRRSKDPEYYHINFFGKKVYAQKIILQHEYMIFFISIPFFLLLGAYFVARLLNIYFYGHL